MILQNALSSEVSNAKQAYFVFKIKQPQFAYLKEEDLILWVFQVLSCRKTNSWTEYCYFCLMPTSTRCFNEQVQG